jgi:hypothetical protein
MDHAPRLAPLSALKGPTLPPLATTRAVFASVALPADATPAARACALIAALVVETGCDHAAAALALRVLHPELVKQVLEDVGSWPSSEPELSALQRLVRR